MWPSITMASNGIAHSGCPGPEIPRVKRDAELSGSVREETSRNAGRSQGPSCDPEFVRVCSYWSISDPPWTAYLWYMGHT